MSDWEVVDSDWEAVPTRDVGPAARRAMSGRAPGPRELSDEEVDAQDPSRARLPDFLRPPGVARGPETRERVASATGRAGLYDQPRSVEEQQYRQTKNERGELGGDPTAQFVVGGVLGGGAGKLAQGIARGLGAAPTAANIIGGGATGATASATQGGDVVQGAAIGAALSGAAPAYRAARGGVAKAAGAARRVLRDPRGELGRTIGALDKAKAAGHLEGDVFRQEGPEIADLRRGAAGANQLALETEQNIGLRTEEDLAAERAHYGTEQQRVLQNAGDTDHYIPDTEAELNRLAANNTVNGVVGDEAMANALDKVRRMTTTDTGAVTVTLPDAMNEGALPTVEPVTAPSVKVADLVKTKRIVDELAGYGMPATPENVPYRQLSSVLRNELENADPEFAALNRRYHEAMNKAETSNVLNYGNDAADMIKTPAKHRAASGRLGRIGDETNAAQLNEPQIRQLSELDPRNATDIARIEAKKALEQTRFGLPHVSRRFEKVILGPILQNSTAAAARIADPLLGRLGAYPDAALRLRLGLPELTGPSPEAIAAGLGARPQLEASPRQVLPQSPDFTHRKRRQ